MTFTYRRPAYLVNRTTNITLDEAEIGEKSSQPSYIYLPTKEKELVK